MAKTRGIACDRCTKVVEADKDAGWRQVILRKKLPTGEWDGKEIVDFCPACCFELGKWLKAYKEEDNARNEEPGHPAQADESAS